jgi:hypothetical protein
MRRHRWTITALALGLAGAARAAGAGQVVIDMPRPIAAVGGPSHAGSAGEARAIRPDDEYDPGPGSLALLRYASARRGPWYTWGGGPSYPVGRWYVGYFPGERAYGAWPGYGYPAYPWGYPGWRSGWGGWGWGWGSWGWGPWGWSGWGPWWGGMGPFVRW